MCVQAWQKARSEGWERSFCEKNFLSQATMELILGLRVQLLGQLRAIGPSLTPSVPLSLTLSTHTQRKTTSRLTTVLKLSKCAWTVCGDVEDVSLSAERRNVFNITRTRTSPVAFTELKSDLID